MQSHPEQCQSVMARTISPAAPSDNDNDNDTLREVPHLSNEGLGLTGKSVGVMTPRKRICCAVEACSLASCVSTNCYGQLAMHLTLR